MINIAPDKKKHLIAGIIMGVVFSAATFIFFPLYIMPGMVITFSLIVFISYGFELFSLITKLGHYDILDAVASIAGGIMGMGMVLLIEWMIKSI